MGELNFISEDPTNITSKYSQRISQSQWQRYKSLIQDLHGSGYTRRQIMEELAEHGFYPSFGQLVAQMTRWRLVRYSKPLSTMSNMPLAVVEYRPSGILLLTRLLQSNETHQLPSLDIGSHQIDLNNADDLTKFMNSMTLAQTQPSKSAMNSSDNQQVQTVCRKHLLTAYLLFLGEAYNHAFNAYNSLVAQLSGSSPTIDLEQLMVTALIGCFKSAVSLEQRQMAIRNLRIFLDGFTPTYRQGSPSGPKDAVKIFQTWYSADCATAKVIFDLLTFYKQSRVWENSQQARWAHDITLREWTCSRLVRLPTWEVAVPFLDNNPVSKVNTGAVFSAENVKAILDWAILAFQDFSPAFCEQLLQVKPYLKQLPALPRILLFWRFRFFSMHAQAGKCPPLEVRQSPETISPMSSQVTACVLARVLLRQIELPQILNHNINGMIMQRLQGFQSLSLDELSGILWTSLREVVAPTYSEREEAVTS